MCGRFTRNYTLKLGFEGIVSKHSPMLRLLEEDG
jgi:hypothetical protein